MAHSYQNLKVFISSPGDVNDERDIAEETIRKISDTCSGPLGISLEVVRWENLPPETPHPEEKIQDVINKKVNECNIFILILYKRYGTISPGQKASNTEREVEQALKLLSRDKKIMFLSYFKNIPPNSDIGKQEQQVKKLRNKLTKSDIWYHSYDTSENFRKDLTHDIYKTVLNYRFSSMKHKALGAFWKLGTTERDDHPRIAIIYPPVDRKYMKMDEPDNVWCNRLVPHVVFEDYKALQKIEKSLRLIGINGLSFFGTSHIPGNYLEMNRVWVCIPRNKLAQKQAKSYESISKFKFILPTKEQTTRLMWRHNIETEEWFHINSPLSKYLTEQRCENPGGEWKNQNAKIIAKDFAIISRFSDESTRTTMQQGTLKDFFIAGVRGLGTWGAGWFLDRRYEAFKSIEDYENIQMLLEVTYENERIINVIDVSNEPKSYFSKENSIKEIKRIISEHQKR